MAKRNSSIEIPNLIDLTFTQTKQLARTSCTKTDQELAEETGIPRATIASALSNPDYHPSAPNMPKLCQALGNNLMIEWIVAQIGGIVVFPPAVRTAAAIQCSIASITKDFSDVLERDAKARMADSPGGNEYTEEERLQILHALTHLAEHVEAAKMRLAPSRSVRKNKKGRP